MRDETIRLTGRLICSSAEEVQIVRAHLPEHIRLSRAEPGCLSFTVDQTADPGIWRVEECFVNQAAFADHQTRTRASSWWAATSAIAREFSISGPD
jgi:quinol monooxygenase YgiN